MSRLTYLNQDTETTELTQFEGDSWQELIKNADAVDQIFIHNAIDKLYEYEELEEQGLLLKLPCKIGDTVYQLINSHIYEYKVIGICFDIFQNKWMYEVAYQIGLEWFKTMCDFDAFGKSKTVFLTKEEAEKALERLECTE